MREAEPNACHETTDGLIKRRYRMGDKKAKLMRNLACFTHLTVRGFGGE